MQAVDLVLSLLRFNPAQRLSADDVLAHPFFASCSAAYPRVLTGTPTPMDWTGIHPPISDSVACCSERCSPGTSRGFEIGSPVADAVLPMFQTKQPFHPFTTDADCSPSASTEHMSDEAVASHRTMLCTAAVPSPTAASFAPLDKQASPHDSVTYSLRRASSTSLHSVIISPQARSTSRFHEHAPSDVSLESACDPSEFRMDDLDPIEGLCINTCASPSPSTTTLLRREVAKYSK